MFLKTSDNSVFVKVASIDGVIIQEISSLDTTSLLLCCGAEPIYLFSGERERCEELSLQIQYIMTTDGFDSLVCVLDVETK